MLIHLVNEEHHALVSSEVTISGDANVIGVGPLLARASETFELCNAYGGQMFESPGLKSGDHVTLRTAGGKYWRPLSSDAIGDNGTFAPSCRFQISRSGGRSGERVRHGDTVAIAVPRLLQSPRWILIDQDGGLIIGPAATSIHRDAARFTFLEANLASLGPVDGTEIDDLIPGGGQTIAVPVGPDDAVGTAAFDVVLSHEGLPPAGTQVNLHLSGSDEFHLRETETGPNLPEADGHRAILIGVGQTSKRLFVVGPAHRPDPVSLFHNPFEMPPTCSLRVAAPARDDFPGHGGDHSETGFFPYADRKRLMFKIERQSLFSFNGGRRDQVEAYGWMLGRSDWSTGLTLNVTNSDTTLLIPGHIFEIVIRTTVAAARGDQFPMDPGVIPPTVLPVQTAVQTLPGGHFRFRGVRSGRFDFDFKMTGFSTQKPALLRVDVSLFEIVGTTNVSKITGDQLAIELVP
jgi:hypothetical protein